ncbi:MAG: hypothetical protein RSC76_00050 [Oscillospiraceae bacterium]
MRFDTPIYFQQITPGGYNASTGNYGADMVTEAKQYASVTNSGVAMLKLVYGELKQGSLTIRIQTQYQKPFDRVRIGKSMYRVDFIRPLRNIHVFVVSEVQHGEARYHI